MSYLRDIMQKIAEKGAKSSTDSKLPTEGEGFSKFHVTSYQSDLAKCTKAMLQYEWAWWTEHIETLELCLTRPEMYNELGGLEHVIRLVQTSQDCQRLLGEVMEREMVRPSDHAHRILPTEHAWELSEEQVKQEWGIK